MGHILVTIPHRLLLCLVVFVSLGELEVGHFFGTSRIMTVVKGSLKYSIYLASIFT